MNSQQPTLPDQDLPTANATPSSTASKNKRKKKKPPAKVESDPLSTFTDDPSTITATPSRPTCPVVGCKERLGIMSILCEWCNMKYCMAHRARAKTAASFKQESMHFLTQQQRDPAATNARSFNVEQSKEELRQKLRGKIKDARGSGQAKRGAKK
ncbi:hypothetical protein BC936DRAFT_146112 [Jimgerdemannia flammicorona]|uniref:AN1-type domain-containing protein n=1 Tax=Jimgerdemannia flammicorona TaxID=994334 RepID=A0A433D8F3_9FUNG|nr:hypothetical protein BC936DRAFT_146112 [Jimgerdemannia flammicorona]